MVTDTFTNAPTAQVVGAFVLRNSPLVPECFGDITARRLQHPVGYNVHMQLPVLVGTNNTKQK